MILASILITSGGATVVGQNAQTQEQQQEYDPCIENPDLPECDPCIENQSAFSLLEQHRRFRW
jgi:hypothetical protein